MVRQLLVVLALAGLLTAASAGPAQAAAAGSATGVSPVKATDASVTGHSRLAHGSGGVRFKLLTTRLQPGNAYTVWWGAHGSGPGEPGRRRRPTSPSQGPFLTPHNFAPDGRDRAAETPGRNSGEPLTTRTEEARGSNPLTSRMGGRADSGQDGRGPQVSGTSC